MLPCLDHEAMLHEGIAPHLAAYVQESGSGDLHELVFVPDERRIEVDTVSTWQEHSPASRARLESFLATRFPGYRVRVVRPSWWRGERRVANACLAQVSLRDVLLGPDLEAVKARSIGCHRRHDHGEALARRVVGHSHRDEPAARRRRRRALPRCLARWNLRAATG